MADPEDGRLDLVILGGFLGAGKSSWARHQLQEGRFTRHHVIVNEAAETPVDTLLLAAATRLTPLAGGCACCEGLPALIASLRDVCDQTTGASAGLIDGILLETSGLADPGRIATAIADDPILGRRLRIREIVVLVDALHGLIQLATEPLARAQIEAAHRLIISKSGTAPADQIAALYATLQNLAPEACITGAELGLSVDLPPPSGAVTLPQLSATSAIRPWRLQVGSEGGWVALSIWLSALLHARGEDVVRVKGVIRTPAGRLLLQSVRRVVQPPEILPDNLTGPIPEEGVIVLIGRNFDGETLNQSWSRFGA